MASESVIAGVSIKDILATVAAATKEERAQLAQLLAGAKPAKKEVVKVAKVEERLSEEVLGQKPEMPEAVELDEDFCHARVGVKLAKEDIVDTDKDDWLGRGPLKFGGFSSKIFLEQQCTNTPSSGQTLCSGCAKKFEKHQEGKDQEKWTAWNGIIGEAPPKKNRYVGSDYSNKVYADWGAAPKSGPSSGKKSSAGAEAKVEAKVEVKVEAKKEVKKEVKVEVKPKAKKEEKPKTEVKAAVVPPAAAPAKKKVVADLYFNPAIDCFIDLEGNCFYSDLDETTLDPIPDMDRKIGTIPKEVDREKAQPSDFTEAEE
jgi:hypothetical protein